MAGAGSAVRSSSGCSLMSWRVAECCRSSLDLDLKMTEGIGRRWREGRLVIDPMLVWSIGVCGRKCFDAN